MPKPPPRSLCLPDIVADPQARADHVAANPPRHGPSHSRTPSIISDTASSSPVPPSPTSTNSHRASAATLSSLASPLATASTRTSLSVHNLSWGNEAKRGSLAKVANANDAKGWSFASLIDSSDKTRSSWSNTFSGSWFGGPSAASEPSSKSPNPKEIKLSPSMIAAVASEEITPKSARPMSYPLTASPQRKPRVGTGLQYYTERNPAPPNSRFQISESESPSSPTPTPVIMTGGGGKEERPNHTPIRSPLEKDSALPDIRVSSG